MSFHAKMRKTLKKGVITDIYEKLSDIQYGRFDATAHILTLEEAESTWDAINDELVNKAVDGSGTYIHID